MKKYVRNTIQPFCERHGYLFSDRIKTVESLSEKLEGGRISNWSDIDDLYACTIVLPTQSHETFVVSEIDLFFERKRIKSRGTTKKAPDTFRFDATRYYAYLKESAADGRPAGLTGVCFEIQMPTAFEFAWSTVTHDLVYKGDHADWKKLRLAAQLKALVEQAETVIEAFEQLSTSVARSEWPEIEVKNAVITRFKSLIKDGVISEVLEPLSWGRFADNIYELVASYAKERKPYRLAIEELLKSIEGQLGQVGASPCPTSGSLFQLVAGHVAQVDSPGSLNRYVMIDSEELRTFHGVSSVHKPFRFDLPEAPYTGQDMSARLQIVGSAGNHQLHFAQLPSWLLTAFWHR